MPSDRVQLFHTCLIDSFFQSARQAVKASLEAAGVEVSIPRAQTCCGQPAFNAGFWEEARVMARHTIQVLEQSPDPIVIPSGSCTHMIRHGYQKIFRDQPDWLKRVKSLASRTFEWSEYIVEKQGVEGYESAIPGRIAYHSSCHLLRGLGISDPPRKLLTGSFHESQIHILSEDCCGFGGVFAVDQPELSTAMLDRKIETILASKADIVTGCDVSCLMQIEGRLRRVGSAVRCMHIAELFSDSRTGIQE
jgi:L-lactate dehydrogenase complex protein LldE